jgi:hypothetical protein
MTGKEELIDYGPSILTSKGLRLKLPTFRIPGDERLFALLFCKHVPSNTVAFIVLHKYTAHGLYGRDTEGIIIMTS